MVVVLSSSSYCSARPADGVGRQRLAQHVGERLRARGRARFVEEALDPRAQLLHLLAAASTSSSEPLNASGCVDKQPLERVDEAGAQRIGALAHDRRGLVPAVAQRAHALRGGRPGLRGLDRPRPRRQRFELDDERLAIGLLGLRARSRRGVCSDRRRCRRRSRNRFQIASDLLRRTGPIVFHSACSRRISAAALVPFPSTWPASRRVHTALPFCARFADQVSLRWLRSSLRRVKNRSQASRKRFQASSSPGAGSDRPAAIPPAAS